MEAKLIQISDILEIDWAILNVSWQIPHGDKLSVFTCNCKAHIRSQVLAFLNSVKYGFLWTENAINYYHRYALV